MSDINLSSELTKIIRQEVELDNLTLRLETNLENIPGWDSITMSCIMVAVERRFSFEFSGEELESLSSFGSLVELVSRKAI